MSIHIGAKEGEIAEKVLLPGDPLRAKLVADNFLEDVHCYSEVRGMFGYTGYYKGKRVSVQGTGMGIPSFSIYGHELINEYGVKKMIRIGSCGSYQEKVKLNDLVLPMATSTTSSLNKNIFQGCDFAPVADFDLLLAAKQQAEKIGADAHVGNVLTVDAFYEEPDAWKLWAKYNVLGVEMEVTALYTLAARFGVSALAILTVSDHFISQDKLTVEERQNSLNKMIEVALEVV
ncbi:purine-nucleoside phosphorylase [Xanthovirga aplysinae]|uniref:purine-nucleoside phosphorylase n=1 Tax=Xanthovirga aplysinae TaxID=2529853 RepID=UPI0012BD5A07|nr:purine-nucleoside phosphorylase [Xanthovirga aplysinae]MTI32328.1 purine-nucleoside phosphorylase [Xanthovirga aplysinae]